MHASICCCCSITTTIYEWKEGGGWEGVVDTFGMSASIEDGSLSDSFVHDPSLACIIVDMHLVSGPLLVSWLVDIPEVDLFVDV